MDHQDHSLPCAAAGHPSDQIHSEKISIGRDSGVHEDQCESGAMLALGPRDRRSVSQSSLGGQEEADDCGGGAEDLDPRIQIELEKLNSSTDVINKLELDLEQARSTFRHLLDESKCHLGRLQKEIGNSVDKARPYYEARCDARICLREAHDAAGRFEKASSAHEAAKEMVTMAEEGFQERGVENFDQAWQEMLNHATTRVNDSEIEKNLSEEEHRVKSMAYQNAEKKVAGLQKSLKRSINKSREYFEVKARLNQNLDDQKRQIQVIEETISMTKRGYADSLKELERISEEIHERRRKQRHTSTDKTDSPPPGPPPDGVRVAGVGAEFPSPSPIERQIRTVIERQKSILSIGQPATAAASTPVQPSKPATSSKRSSVSSAGARSSSPISSSTTESPDDVTSSIHDVNQASSLPTTSANAEAAQTPNKIISMASDPKDALAKSPSRSEDDEIVRPEDISFDLTASPIRAACIAANVSRKSAAAGRKGLRGKLNNKLLTGVELAGGDDESDADSLASLEMLGDDQIEHLMKDTTIQNAAENLLETGPETQAEKSTGN